MCHQPDSSRFFNNNIRKTKKYYYDYKIAQGSGHYNALGPCVRILRKILTNNIACDVGKGATSDSSYVKEVQKNVQAKDLVLKDLGYFKMDDLKYVDKAKAYYISKIKKYTVTYINDGKKCSQVDILEKVKDLAEGQTIDFPDAYIRANKKLKTRLIITKLSEEDKLKRENKTKKASGRNKSRMDAERSDLWNSVNIYATNIDVEMMKATEIHELYPLRWQVEIMFKVWKSIFKIDKVKKVSLHRFECFLYGKLISVVLNSIIVFKSKQYAYLKEKKYISIYKAFAIAREYSCKTRDALLKNTKSFWTLINEIILLILKRGVKCKKKNIKMAEDIIEITNISTDLLV